MLEQIFDYFLLKPQRMISLGRFLAESGSVIVMIGLIANVGAGATGSFGTLGGTASQEKTLAEMFPSLPTWWIPESFLGAIPALGLVAIGIWLVITGKRVQRFINY